MVERHLQVQKYTPFEVGGATEHCRASESRFFTFLAHSFQMRTPSANVPFGVVCS